VSDAAVLDPQNPWPWLDPFTEAARDAFGGRKDDVQALLRGVLAMPVCVLFGKSGLGKTSLLLAGLAPKLRAQAMLPVPVRLEHRPGAAGVSAQLHRALTAAAAEARLHWSQPSTEDRDLAQVSALWERLHERDQYLRDEHDRRWTPVFMLDQFEEVFTLEPDQSLRAQAFQQLGDLLENRVPPVVARRLDADEALLDRIDLDHQAYRFLISIREDFLAELEYWADLIPRLAMNRVRLLPLSDKGAREAICKTGGALVTADSAERIVQFLGRQLAPGVRVRDDRRIEPALLSLVCASLNADRLAATPPGAQLDVSDLEIRGAKILDRFYDDAFGALDADGRAGVERWVELNLITSSGSRRPYPLNAVDDVLRPSLAKLEKRRLLRTEPTEQGDQVELVHDRLAAVASQRAVARQRVNDEADRLRREKDEAEKQVLVQRAELADAAQKRAVAEEERARAERARADEAERAKKAEQTRADEAVHAKERAGRQTRLVTAVAVIAMALAAISISLWRRAETAQRRANVTFLAAKAALASAQSALSAADPAAAPSGADATRLLSEARNSYNTAARAVNQLQPCSAERRIYPQIAAGTDGAALNAVTPALRAAGFIVAPVQSMPRQKMPNATAVRYFRPTESQGADDAVAALRKAGMTAAPVLTQGYEATARPCQYELWIAPGS